MINKILRDMINKRKVVAFVNDVLVGTESKEGHNKVVEEVLKRLEEKDLYVKPEKCVWKMKKMPFLGVVMGEGKVKIVINRLDPIEELYEMYSEKEDTPRIVEIGDDRLDFVSDTEGLADPYMDL